MMEVATAVPRVGIRTCSTNSADRRQGTIEPKLHIEGQGVFEVLKVLRAVMVHTELGHENANGNGNGEVRSWDSDVQQMGRKNKIGVAIRMSAEENHCSIDT